MKNIGKIMHRCAFILCLFLLLSIPLKSFAEVENEIRYEISIIKEPTKDDSGLREYINPDTGERFVEEIPATGHIWSEWVVDKEPTKEEEGHRYRVCIKYPDKPHYEEDILPKLESTKKIISKDIKGQDAGEHGDKISKGAENKRTYNKVSRETVSKKLSENDENKQLVSVENNAEDIYDSIVKKDSKNKKFILAGANSVDVLAGAALAGLSFWYIFILLPMIITVLWIKRKKEEVRDAS